MLNRIDKTFERLRQKGRKAFIVFLTAGDPDIKTTERLVVELEARGVDIIELGVPFSDPIADGPVIQAASIRALKNGIDLKAIFSLARRLRKGIETPLVLMTYYNPVYQYGLSAFARDAAEAGVDGVIVPDLPPEEAQELRRLTEKRNLALIFLTAPNTPEERVKMIAKQSRGFLYCLSHIGITGMTPRLETTLKDFLLRVRKLTAVPIAVGFGVSKPAHVRRINRYADGVVVGSAIIKHIRENEGRRDLVKKTGDYVEDLMGC